MKKLFLALVATVMFSGASFGQVLLDPDPGNSTWLEVPDSLTKSTTKSSSKDVTTTINKYVKEIDGIVSVSFDSYNNVVSILVPKKAKLDSSSLVKYMNSQSKSDHGCWDKPNEIGTIGCCLEAIIEGIRDLF